MQNSSFTNNQQQNQFFQGQSQSQSNNQFGLGNNSGPQGRVDRFAQIGAQINNQQVHASAPQQTVHLNPNRVSQPQSQEIHPQTMIAGSTSEAHLSSLKDSFINSANTLTAFYKQSCNAFNLAYHQGQQDAYEEVFVWFMSQGENGSFKHVSVNQFNQFIQERMNNNGNVDQPPKTNPAQKIVQPDPSPSDQEAKLMPPPENRPPRYKTNTEVNSHQRTSNEPSSQELIRMCANQCLKEQYEGQTPINKKINSNIFQGLKFQDNKKRVRPQMQAEDEEREEEQIPYEQPESEMQMDCEMSMPASQQQPPSQPGQSERDFLKVKKRNILTNNSHSPPHQQNDSQQPQLQNQNQGFYKQ